MAVNEFIYIISLFECIASWPPSQSHIARERIISPKLYRMSHKTVCKVTDFFSTNQIFLSFSTNLFA
jgi:hypothetical protein